MQSTSISSFYVKSTTKFIISVISITFGLWTIAWSAKSSHSTNLYKQNTYIVSEYVLCIYIEVYNLFSTSAQQQVRLLAQRKDTKYTTKELPTDQNFGFTKAIFW